MRQIQRAVVSGATSFIGSAVCAALLERGCQVYGLVRPESAARRMLPVHPGFHEVTCALADSDSWTDAVGRADTFFHFAWEGPGAKGRADPALQEKNAALALLCMRGAARLGVDRFFFSGSQAEYGPREGKTAEDAPCSPVLEYGKGKLAVWRAAQPLARDLGMDYVHARIFSVYGPNDHPYTLIPSCIRRFLRDETMELSECTNKWNFLHVRDAAEAAIRLTECDLDVRAGIVNLAGDDTRTLRDYVEEIHRLAGGLGRCAFGAWKGMERPVDNWPDIARLVKLTGWSPKVTFAEGVAELIEAEKMRMREEADGR